MPVHYRGRSWETSFKGTNKMTSVDDIKAKILTVWNKGMSRGCRFLPGSKVTVIKVSENESDVLQKRSGQSGIIIAVTCGKDKMLRGASWDGALPRAYTRYYVQFADGRIHGFHSHYLESNDSFQDRVRLESIFNTSKQNEFSPKVYKMLEESRILGRDW